MSNPVKFPRGGFRAPRYPYRSNGYWLPHMTQDGIGELIQDAVSGAWFPAIYVFNGPFGPVDGRAGATVDFDADDHEMAVTMRGPLVPPRDSGVIVNIIPSPPVTGSPIIIQGLASGKLITQGY